MRSLIVFMVLFIVSSAYGTQSESVELIYDASQFSESSSSKTVLLDQLNEEMRQQDRSSEKGEYRVPLAPENEEQLKPFRMLTPETAEKFLLRKQQFLEKISLALKWLRLSPALHNKALHAFNIQFFAGAPAIARANATGGTFKIQLGGGLGLGSLLTEKIRESAIGKFYPRSGGFFIGLGFGVSLLKNDTARGSHWSLQVFADISTLKSVKSLLGTVGLDIGLAYTAEYKNPEGHSRLQSIRADVLGPLGTIRYNDSLFYYGVAGGPSLPPFFDKAMIYSLNEKRLVIFELDFEFLSVVKKNLGRWMGFSAPACQKIFL